MTPALSWAELEALNTYQPDLDLTNAHSRLRLFSQQESDLRVTLYRDHHAWCPYCQKVWLWLEEMRIPYRVEKVTMFCYGQKEAWYKRKVPSGMLPALELDGRVITESDVILQALEETFGVLYRGLRDPEVMPLRTLERLLFRAWCQWLCTPPPFLPFQAGAQEQRHREHFVRVAQRVEEALAQTPGSYFLEQFSTADVIFTPYVERMHASLFYYKGYSLWQEHPRLGAWFEGLESRATYRGTQGDFHTHAHDLPPQMGGCWSNDSPQALANQAHVNEGPWLGLPDVTYPEPTTARSEALYRVLRHRDTLIEVNPADNALVDQALRCALTHLMTLQDCPPPPGSDPALRYLRDRVNVPRDMSIYAAKWLRQSLEATAALAGDQPGIEIPSQHRKDQDPKPFLERRGRS